MKPDDLYHRVFSDYCLHLYCYFQKVSADISSGLIQVFVVWISETKPDDFYHQEFSDYCLHLYCYFHNVSTDMSSGLLQVFVVWISETKPDDFLSSRVFGQLSSSLLLFPQRFDKQDTYRNGYRCWCLKLLRRQSSGACRFNPDCRRVTTLEYLTLVPGYD